MRTSTLGLLASLLLIALPDPSTAADETAYLRESCGALSPCFTTTGALETWIWGTRNPTAAAPLTVEVGPGDFEPFTCNNGGYVTLRGAGREISAFVSDDPNDDGAIHVVNCTSLGFEDLQVRSQATGIRWEGGGTASLTDVDVFVGGSTVGVNGWWDNDGSCVTERALIYWWNTRIDAEATAVVGSLFGNFGVYGQCAEHWFYGSEISVRGSTRTPLDSQPAVAVYLLGGEARLFGSAVRVQVAEAIDTKWARLSGFVAGFAAMWVGGPSTLHMHGGVIAADASTSTEVVDAIGIELDNVLGPATPFVHTPDTAFALTPSPATGSTSTRLRNTQGVALSPFLWPPSSTPPPVDSLQGADLYVDTNCAPAGCGKAAHEDTHLMIYSDACSAAGPWFDTVTGSCRQLAP